MNRQIKWWDFINWYIDLILWFLEFCLKKKKEIYPRNCWIRAQCIRLFTFNFQLCSKLIRIMYNLNWDETRIKRQIKFHSSVGFRIISKIPMNPKDNGFSITELHHRYFPWKSPRFWETILDGGFQSYRNRQR